MEKEKKVGMREDDRCMGKGNYSNNRSSNCSLCTHKHSQTISKSRNQPKIRIIHIFAPEIIKTDAGNFRELVQRLTGKPTNSDEKHCNLHNPTFIAAARDHEHSSTRRSTNIGPAHHKPKMNKMELRNSNDHPHQSRDEGLLMKQQVGVCCNVNDDNSGGYLGGFSDLEGFISELSQFPLLPLDFDDTTLTT